MQNPFLAVLFVLAPVVTSGCGLLQWSMLNQATKDQTERLGTEYPMYKINDRFWLDQNDDHCDYLGLVRAKENLKGRQAPGSTKIDSTFAEATRVMDGNAFFMLNGDPPRAWAFFCPEQRLK